MSPRLAQQSLRPSIQTPVLDDSPPRSTSGEEMVDAAEVDAMLKALRLPAFRRHLEPLITDAESREYSYRTFLALLCAEELAAGTAHRIERRVRDVGGRVKCTG